MNRKIALFGLLTLIFIGIVCFVNAQINDTVPYIDPEILKEFNKTLEVRIIVKVIDDTDITILSTDSEEEQAIKDRTKKEILENKTREVIASLPQSEFKLKDTFLRGDGFYGNITKKGFDILIKNPNLYYVTLDGYVSIGKISPIETVAIEKINESSSRVNYSNSNLSKKSENKSKITITPIIESNTSSQNSKLKSRVRILSSTGILLLLVIMFTIILKFRKR